MACHVNPARKTYLRAKLTDQARGGTPQEILEEVDQWGQAEAWAEMAKRAGDLVGSLDRLGYWAEIGARLERALAAAETHLVAQPEREAALLGGLGTIALKQAEWDRAIATYERALETMERAGDIHGMASTWVNMGLLYVETERSEEGKPLLAQGYLALTRLGSPDAEVAARGLVRACGSMEAANAYLAEVAKETSGEG